jgi:hypothetical protein
MGIKFEGEPPFDLGVAHDGFQLWKASVDVGTSNPHRTSL